MKRTVKTGIKIVRNLFAGLLLFILLYLGLAVSLPLIAVNSKNSNTAQDVAIYIKTNGVHTDIVVPMTNTIKDWRTICDPTHTRSALTSAQFVAMGWGDKGFYLNTPEWSDLKASTAFNAAFYLGTSAMHTTFYHAITEDDTCIKINLSNDEYQKLVTFIESSFKTDSAGKSMLIAGSYGNFDSFYEAEGKYNLFYTCNSWANNALKAANQKAALWSLTDAGIFRHYR